jgi:hypothetical protein
MDEMAMRVGRQEERLGRAEEIIRAIYEECDGLADDNQ